jgi:cytochrome P450
MTSLENVDFFRDASIIDDPNPYYHALRSKCPVLREPHHGVLMVTGYAEALEVLANRNGSYSNSVAVHGPIPPLPFTPQGDDITADLEKHRPGMPWSALIVAHDGAAHQAIRTMLTSMLTHSRLKKNEEYMTGLVDRLLDKFIDNGKCEFITEYAHALSTLVIADLLGVPEEDRDMVLSLIGPDPTQVDGSDKEEKFAPDTLSTLEHIFRPYLEARRGKQGSGMLFELANATFKDGTLPDISVPIRLAKFLFVAGQDTSARLMAGCFQFLGDNPELQQRLRADPSRIGDFIEETLRFDPPVKVLSRLATKTTAIGDVKVPAGTILTVGLGAASRDPNHFENPDALDIDRGNARDHLSFSRGSHACPGAPLARSETRLTLERFFARTSNIRISEKEHGPANARRYEYEPTYLLRGLRALHIEFTKA